MLCRLGRDRTLRTIHGADRVIQCRNIPVLGPLKQPIGGVIQWQRTELIGLFVLDTTLLLTLKVMLWIRRRTIGECLGGNDDLEKIMYGMNIDSDLDR